MTRNPCWYRGCVVPRMKLRSILPVLVVAACQSDREAQVPSASVAVAPPMAGVASAWEAAGGYELEDVPPKDYPGLHNVYRLSNHVISGSEPHGERALRHVAEMGVKTILSVDGKVPDAKTASEYGMRYVHVPIEYSGIDGDALLRIAKTFRELDGPFYVHCFHGKHRGPAAAAVGRLVRDGASRETALAEMRQWCGTSSKYEGLYRVIASADMPSADATAKLAWDFPAAHPLGGYRSVMIDVTRHFDNLKALQKRDWEVDPEHPDVDPVNEADKLASLFARGHELDEVKRAADDFRGWSSDSVDYSARLRTHLRRAKAGGAKAKAGASKALRVLKQTCNACHGEYRNR